MKDSPHGVNPHRAPVVYSHNSMATHGRTMSVAVLVALLVTALPLAAGAQGFKWWLDDGVQKKLTLTADQARRIDDIFQASLPDLRKGKQQLDTVEQELARLMESSDDEWAVTRQVDRVEAARADLNKTRTIMLLRMRRILSAEQRVRLDEFHKARLRDLAASAHR